MKEIIKRIENGEYHTGKDIIEYKVKTFQVKKSEAEVLTAAKYFLGNRMSMHKIKHMIVAMIESKNIATIAEFFKT